MLRSVRAAWLRGGTSKGLFLQPRDLPPAGPARDALILAALGSPDPSGMQLNGLGGGISSTSKVAIISRSEREGYDVDYLFGQVEIKDRRINWNGSCGNLSAAVGPFAFAEGLVKPSNPGGDEKVRVWQVNQSYGMIVHVPSGVSMPSMEPNSENAPSASDVTLIELAGVPGREPAIYVELLSPHGDKLLLPTGRAVDVLHLPDGSEVEATLVTAGNPTVIVSAKVAGLTGAELPEQMDYGTILPLVDHLREQGAKLLGVELTDQPRVAFVAPPCEYVATTNAAIAEDASHILSRISTPGRIHHAHTGTGSIALACGAGVEGSVPWRCIPEAKRPRCGDTLKIGHPGGVMEVKATVRRSNEGIWYAAGAGFDRTARYLMRGELFLPPPERAP